ncbi:uncharacterized protein CC84DRAFT_388391 [Paraphaeosphaeria sporulosa]|uniref:DUF1772-domain-containing protein n=1 Tax=Paraphaeosphaeria sporulosa TaxID=1460663 RepID=A0A177BWT3_9PLEO|nr:uncharacterized protein CC84DRAFT_388391 [Paraphaeosphaeria sporulosa]OAF99211.1 hypothetical protein CC84DRAFT_388391 [Paraphaeosphaeria sporulosa]
MSVFDVPMLASQPASRSLPLIRWLFSRGSHIFPTAAFISSSGFAYLSYAALPPFTRRMCTLLSSLTAGGQPTWYAAAAVLAISIAPWTALVMVPEVNFELIRQNEEKGGKRSKDTPDEATGRSAEESVNSEGDRSQWTDLSGPQERTREDSTAEEDAEVKGLLEGFGRLNGVRVGLIGVGGVMGLVGALSG